MKDKPPRAKPSFELPARWWLRLGHDLRGPIAPMRLAVQLLHDQQMAAPDRDEALQLLERQLDHLLANIDDVGDLLRLNAGTFALNLVADDLNLLIDIMCGRIAMIKNLEDKQVSLHCVPSESPVIANHDPMRLAALLEFLIRKSAQYAAHGTQLTLALEEHGDHVRFSITGAGNSLAADADLIYVTATEPGAVDALEAKPILMRELARLNNVVFVPIHKKTGISFELPLLRP